MRPDGTWAESRFAPDRDAERRVAEAGIISDDSVLLIGMGGGELPRAILGALGPDGKLTIAEPIGEIALLVKIADPRLTLIAGGAPAEFYAALAEVHADRTIIHPGATFPEGFEGLRDRIEDAEIRRRSSHRFAGATEENCERNRERFESAPGVSRLAGKFSGADIFVAGGGPSLEPIARETPSSATWVAVGTALRPLHILGIHPVLAVITDPQSSVAAQVQSLPRAWLPPLVFFQTTAHDAVRRFDEVYTAYPEGESDHDALPAGGTVTTTAIGAAILLGARRILLAGVDLCEPGGRTHSRGTAREDAAVAGTNRFGSLENLRPSGTGRQFDVYARAIEEIVARHPEIEFVQLSKFARPLRGVKTP